MIAPKRWRISKERELAKLLWSEGFIVCRSGASGGSSRSWPQLDLLVYCPRTGRGYAIEVKTSTSLDTCNAGSVAKWALAQLSEKERKKVKELLGAGAEVLVAVWVSKCRSWFWFKALEEGGDIVLKSAGRPNCRTLSLDEFGSGQ